MRHFLILAVWGLVYIIPSMVQGPTPDFYTNQILYSVMLVISLIFIDEKIGGGKYSAMMITIIICLTSCFALFNLCTEIGRLFKNYFLYDIYNSVSYTINVLEFVTLVIGTYLGVKVDVGQRTGMVVFNLGALPRLVSSYPIIDLHYDTGMDNLRKGSQEKLH